MMTPNQMISKTREELNAMADRCRDMAEDLEELADSLPVLPAAAATLDAPMEGFEAVSKMLRTGKRPDLGQTVITTLEDGAEAVWRIIDTARMAARENGVRPVVAQLVKIMDYRPFSMPSKQFPWGCNRYEISSLADWLDDCFLRRLTCAAQDSIVARRDLGGEDGRKLWLLSADEAGFGDLGQAFEWYACEDEDERDERRQLKDSDGDPASWWLRTPNSGNALNVRNVNTSGALYSSIAYGANGVAPACIIG